MTRGKQTEDLALLVLGGNKMVFKSLGEDYICLEIASGGVGLETISCKCSLNLACHLLIPKIFIKHD